MARRGSSTLEESISEEINEQLASDRASSPAGLSPRSPTSPRYARNTLGVDSTTPRHGSIAGIGVGVTSPTNTRKKKLDPSDPSTWTSTANASNDLRPRSASETQSAGVPAITFDGGSESKHEERKGSGSMAAALSGQLHNITISPPYAQEESPKADQQAAQSSKTLGSPVSEKRRVSNQSASFSTDSEAVGALAQHGDKNEEVLQSSEEERSTSDEEQESPVAERGRKRDSNRNDTATEETQANAENQIHLSPEIRVDEADDDMPTHHVDHHSGKLSEARGPIVPRSNYRSASPALSPAGNDDDELTRAKAMEVRVSELDEKVKDRTVKLILRGDWASFQDHENEAQESRHEPRFYLVCSDLSNEASYALEWTVGTLLKDGDTLLLLNAHEDENASKHKDVDEPSLEVKLESAKAAEETNNTLVALTRQTSNLEGRRATKSALGVGQHQRSASAQARPRTKKDEEREKAIDKLEADFMRYIRKTALQVRCMFEVIHCRSPRHLVLNAIDELEPTLVVVGTRGLSSVKGVMLGSFSNYLVQKSSIPVMVARKRLKKTRGAKVSSDKIRMTNNLSPFGLTSKRKSLTQARID